MQKYFFLLTIGPVQSFIAEARKTQDLFGGSRLLSALMRKAQSLLVEHFNASLIFPDAQISVSLPNRILVLVAEQAAKDFQLNQGVDLGKKPMDYLGHFIDQSLRTMMIQQMEAILAAAGLSEESHPDLLANCRLQVVNHLEIYWATCPADDYRSGFQRVHMLIGAAKNSRTYEQWSEKGRKCQLDGVRNVLIYRPSKSDEKHQRLPTYVYAPAVGIQNFLLNRGEGLSALSFTKRRFQYSRKNHFDSTTEIALLHTLEVLSANVELRSAINNIRNNNTQFFYEENTQEPMVSKLLEDADSSINKDRLRMLQSTIAKAAGDRQLTMTKYYALLLFDGDNMGKWWSGDPAYVRQDIDLKSYHLALSAALANFAKKAKGILESDLSKRGRLVYAGGDDFLGFINLEFLLDVLQELRNAFQYLVQSAIQPYIQNEVQISFSAGLQIAHYKEPLRLVVTGVKEAEKNAKKWNAHPKDNCCISIFRASGEPSQMLLPFLDTDGRPLLQKMDKLTQLLARYFSSGTTDKLINALDAFPLKEMKTGLSSELALLRPKLWNTLVRSCILSTSDPEYDHRLQMAFELCLELAAASHSWQNFLALLDTASFLIRHTQLQFIQNTEHAESAN